MSLIALVLVPISIAIGVLVIAKRDRVAARMQRIVLRHYGAFGKMVAEALTPTLVIVGAIVLTVAFILAALRAASYA